MSKEQHRPDSEESAPASFREKLLDNLYDGVYFVDQDRRITYWNQGAERLSGYTREEAVGRYCFNNLLQHVNEQGCALCMNGCPLSKTISDGQRREDELYLRHKSGHRVPVCVRVAPITDETGKITGAVEIFTDVSEKKKVERRVGELENLAFRDPLTGLLNRRYTEMKVAQALQETEEFGRSYGLLMIDVDHFKQVNDTAGHEAGDSVLKALSATLLSSLRRGDVVGRWGGEEFVVLLIDVSRTMLAELAERCRTLIAESSVSSQNARLRVTASIGATILQSGDTADSAVRRADQLMYQSKNAGRNRVTVG